MFWVAGSRAIRAPTPFDTDVQEFVGGQLFVLGDPEFKTEKVTAYELGYRGNPDATFSFSASASTTSTTICAPSKSRRRCSCRCAGAISWKAAPMASKPGPTSSSRRGGACRRECARCTNAWSSARRFAIAGVRQAGNDPSSRYYLKSSMDLRRFTLDVMLRKVGALPDPALDDYTELNARFAWRVNDRLEVAIKGFNLLNEIHLEYPEPRGSWDPAQCHGGAALQLLNELGLGSHAFEAY